MQALLTVILIGTMVRQRISLQDLRVPRCSDPASLVAYIVLVGLAMMWVGMLISGATTLLNRWLQPIMMFFPLVIAIAASKPLNTNEGVLLEAQQNVEAININQAILGLVCSLSVMIALPLVTLYTKVGRPAANQLNYETLQTIINASLGKAPAAILSTNYSFFANLRLYQPDLKIIHPFLSDPARVNDAPLVILWEGHGAMPDNVKELAVSAKARVDRLATFRSRLVRVDQPDIGLDISFAYDSAQGLP